MNRHSHPEHFRDAVDVVASTAPRAFPAKPERSTALASDPLWGEFASAFESLFEVLRDPASEKRARIVARRAVGLVAKKVVARAARERKKARA